MSRRSSHAAAAPAPVDVHRSLLQRVGPVVGAGVGVVGALSWLTLVLRSQMEKATRITSQRAFTVLVRFTCTRGGTFFVAHCGCWCQR